MLISYPGIQPTYRTFDIDCRIKAQLNILDGKDTHVLMTICQKDGKWQDEDASCSDPHSSKCKTPDFKSLGKDQMGFRNANHLCTN